MSLFLLQIDDLLEWIWRRILTWSNDTRFSSGSRVAQIQDMRNYKARPQVDGFLTRPSLVTGQTQLSQPPVSGVLGYVPSPFCLQLIPDGAGKSFLMYLDFVACLLTTYINL